MGPPIKAVMAPTGNIMGSARVLAPRSARSNNTEPHSIDEGMRYLMSPPTTTLQICGANRHTKPMAPVKHITIAVERQAVSIAKVLVLPGLKPRLLAVSSPSLMALTGFDKNTDTRIDSTSVTKT